MRILIAEDDATSRLMLAAVLKKAGHEVLDTVSGAEAWAELQKPEAPSLAILDWMMPEMDGLEVVRRVRELTTDRPPYILMLTSKTEKAEVIAGLDAGANDYLTKPFDVGELYARIEVGRRMVELQDELVKSREALAHQAAHDPLTGLPNRRALFDRLHEELARAVRNEQPLVVGMLDIDDFKAVNDTHGHQTGDDVLCELARILTDNLREYDTVGRIGGEEFLIITSTGPMGDPAALFDRLGASVADAQITTRAGTLSVTVSIGVAASDGAGTVDELIAAADAALYRAKAEGRNRVIYCRTTTERSSADAHPDC